MATKEKEEPVSEDKGGASMMKVVIVAVTLSLLLGGGLVGGTYYFVSSTMTAQMALANASGDEGDDVSEESIPTAPPQYFSMDPKFVVSFNSESGARFMQFSIEIMSRDSEHIKQIELHMPAIRSSLLMLFGGQNSEQMLTREGKEKLLIDAMADINITLQKISGADETVTAVEAAYFNSFVIQ